MVFCQLSSCSDPVEPDYEYIDGLVYIDALASTSPGTSYVTISETKTEFGVSKSTPVLGALVYFVNSDNGEKVLLEEREDSFFPPNDFALGENELWHLEVILKNGRTYRSSSERVLPSVPSLSTKITYKNELLFSEAFGSFVPGHEITATFEDPADEENYYYWRFRTYEKLIYCNECYNYTIYRNSECFQPNPNGGGPPLKEYYTYACETNCWRIRYNQSIKILSDKFINGRQVTDIPVGEVLLFTNDNILIELQQFSVSSDAYRYLKKLKDLVDNNGGFNSPLPAVLVGNLYNPEDGEEFVLGRFTVASGAISTSFVERIFIEDPQLEQRLINSPEENEVPPPIVSSVPCVEGPFRTGIRPDNWIDMN